MVGVKTLSHLFTRVFGSRNERLLKRYRSVAGAVEALEQRYLELDDQALRGVTEELRGRLAAGQTPEDILYEAFAALREASRRAQDHRHFPCQLHRESP